MRFKYLWITIAMMVGACGATQDDATVSGVGPIEQPTVDLIGQPSLCDYPMMLGTPDHVGRACPTLRGMRVVAILPQDSGAQGSVEVNGFIQNNEGATITMGDFVAVPKHAGVDELFHTDDTWAAGLWRWSPRVTAPGATLQHVADVDSSWLAVDTAVRSLGFTTNGYVQAYPPAFANGVLYMPISSARIAKIDPATGSVLAVINPFASTPFDGDPRLTTAGGLTVAPGGVVYYTATAWPLGDPAPLGADPRGSWLVRIMPDGASTIVDWTTIASSAVGVTQRNDLCFWPFGTAGSPLATGPDSEPPQFHCGTQRPVLNAAPAIRPDGALVLFSNSNNNIWQQYLVFVSPITMLPIQATLLREHFHNGCGVRIPITGSGDFGDACDAITAHGTTHLGVDPEFNRLPSNRAGDLDSNNVFCLSNGDCGVGGYNGGFAGFGDFDARGGIVLVHPDGTIAAINEEFGWDVTPTVSSRNGTTTLLQDRDLFSDLDLQVARYSATFSLEATSNVAIDPNTAGPIEFVDENIPSDTDGHSYGYDASGHLYQFDQSGQVSDVVALIDPVTGEPCAMDAVAGFMARDRAGRLYVPACGNVYVVESRGAEDSKPDLGMAARRTPLTSAQRASALGKMTAVVRAHGMVPPTPD